MSHFNEISREWDTPEKIQMNQRNASIIKEHLSFSPRHILEIGCGTGLLGQQFLDGESSLLGVDTSSGMLEVFKEKFRQNPRVRSQELDMENASLTEKFDLIISSMAFHHLKNPAAIVEKLRKNLMEGGVLAVIDLDQEDGSFHPDPVKMGVHHFGFNEQVVRSWGHSYKKIEREIVHVMKKEKGEYPLFLALFYA